MEITAEIKKYVTREIRRRINSKIEYPFANNKSAGIEIRNYATEKVKDDVLEDIKNRFNVSDEIINKSELKIHVYYTIEYCNGYEKLDKDIIENRVIIEMQLNPDKFKTIDEIDSLIDSTIESNKSKNS